MGEEQMDAIENVTSSYEPRHWACGDIITADGLNNLETGVQEALACCDSGGGVL